MKIGNGRLNFGGIEKEKPKLRNSRRYKYYCRRICFYFPINSGPKQRKWERKTAKLLGRKN